jgi:hypothetical protein
MDGCTPVTSLDNLLSFREAGDGEGTFSGVGFPFAFGGEVFLPFFFGFEIKGGRVTTCV